MATAVNTAEQVAEALRLAIRQAEILPGEHVRQEYWAKRLGVSRVPIREALKILVGDQLVSHDPHRGYFVSKLAISDMAQIYRMRILLEPEVLRGIDWPDEPVLAEMSEQVDRMSDLLSRGQVTEAMELDRQFHFRLYDLSPLSYMVAEVKRLWAMAEGFRRTWMIVLLQADPAANGVRNRHKAMVRYLRTRDSDKLVSTVLEERLELLERLNGHPVGESLTVAYNTAMSGAPQALPKDPLENERRVGARSLSRTERQVRP